MIKERSLQAKEYRRHDQYPHKNGCKTVLYRNHAPQYSKSTALSTKKQLTSAGEKQLTLTVSM
jgi:hypothetical protein